MLGFIESQNSLYLKHKDKEQDKQQTHINTSPPGSLHKLEGTILTSIFIEKVFCHKP